MGMLEVDTNGLKELQKGKHKKFIINELCQNVFDEKSTICKIDISFYEKTTTIILKIEDDNPEGFKDITHAYTLFKHTDKRYNPEQRGRFNLAEKQIAVVSEKTTIKTTKGTIVLNPKTDKRTKLADSRKEGSEVTVVLKGTEKEYNEMLEHTKKILQPKDITYTVNGNLIRHRKPFKSFKASLDTEVLKDGVMRDTTRNTYINLIESNGQSFIYEMGIPIMKIDTPWHIDIQQKIPLAVDRETIRAYYIQDVYAEVLNNTYDILTEENSSELWVRKATRDERVQKDAVKTVLTKRFGERFLVANSFDPNANDEARARGYNVITGNQLSSEEWNTVRDMDLIRSTTELFGAKGLAEEKEVTPGKSQYKFAEFAQKIAKEFLGINIKVRFVKSNDNSGAYYGDKTLTYNLNRLPKDFFDGLNAKNIKLLVHEIAHERGNHTEHDYHDCITTLTGRMVMKALNEPKFYKGGKING